MCNVLGASIIVSCCFKGCFTFTIITHSDDREMYGDFCNSQFSVSLNQILNTCNVYNNNRLTNWPSIQDMFGYWVM